VVAFQTRAVVFESLQPDSLIARWVCPSFGQGVGANGMRVAKPCGAGFCDWQFIAVSAVHPIDAAAVGPTFSSSALMIADVRFAMPAGVSAVAGLVILHMASRKGPKENRHVGLARGMAFFSAGLLLVVLPLVAWCVSFRANSANHPHSVSPASVLWLAGYLDAAFLWMIWNICSYGYRPPVAGENQWDRNWGESYSADLKKRLLEPVFERLESENGIGDLVVDIGSGAQPVSKFLSARPGRKFILIDIAAKNRIIADSQFLRADVESVMRPVSFSYRKVALRVCGFLGNDPRAVGNSESVTTLVFSDILNYVDFRGVIGGFAKFLRPGGRIIITNLPTRGICEEFSPNGLKTNEDLYAVLEEEHFEIESKEFPCRPEGVTDESGELVVLVAKKRTGMTGRLECSEAGFAAS
jgi:hypothetical protein